MGNTSLQSIVARPSQASEGCISSRDSKLPRYNLPQTLGRQVHNGTKWAVGDA